MPVPASVLRPGSLAYDMMYGPAAQGFLDWATQHGAQPRDGLGMLVEQAAEAFQLWRGQRPPSAQVLAELRAAIAAGRLNPLHRPCEPCCAGSPWCCWPCWRCSCSSWLRIAAMAVVDPESTSFQRSEAWAQLRQDGGLRWRQQWVPYAQISDHLKRAVIASEDDNFVNHDGVDWDAIEKAWERNAKAEAQAAKPKAAPPTAPCAPPRSVGGSTITQQLAKNLLLSGERTLLRKGQEFVLTLALEQLLTKQRILEIYLNNVEWGNGIFGAEAAAQHYYRKSAAQLAPHEAARLAVMLPAPAHADYCGADGECGVALSRAAGMADSHGPMRPAAVGETIHPPRRRVPPAPPPSTASQQPSSPATACPSPAPWWLGRTWNILGPAPSHATPGAGGAVHPAGPVAPTRS